MELLTAQMSPLEEAHATNRGLIHLLGEQARTIGFTQFRLELASEGNQQAVMAQAAEFLAAYFGPISNDGLSAWSDQTAEAVHRKLLTAIASPNRPEEVELARAVLVETGA